MGSHQGCGVTAEIEIKRDMGRSRTATVDCALFKESRSETASMRQAYEWVIHLLSKLIPHTIEMLYDGGESLRDLNSSSVSRE